MQNIASTSKFVFRRQSPSLLAASCLFFLLAAPSRSHAQFSAQQPGMPQQSPTSSSNPNSRPTPLGFPKTADDQPQDPTAMSNEARRLKMANDERRKKLLADTAKLVELANSLQAEVEKSTKDELSVTVIKKAGDMEKLAHDVKERMRN